MMRKHLIGRRAYSDTIRTNKMPAAIKECRREDVSGFGATGRRGGSARGRQPPRKRSIDSVEDDRISEVTSASFTTDDSVADDHLLSILF
jgi:hypothetical protein